MRSALSFVLAASLVCGVRPAAAEEPGPIERSIQREATRLAQAPVAHRRSRPSRILKDTLIGAGIGGGVAALMGSGLCAYCSDDDKAEATVLFGAGGAAVGTLVGAVVGALGGRDSVALFAGPQSRDVAPGTFVMLAVRGGAPVPRTFVHASEADIVILNASIPALSEDGVKTLRELAARDPGAFIAAEGGASRVIDDVRLARDGVFISTRKVAELAQILERIPRADLEAGRSSIVIPGSRGMGLAGRIAIGTGVGFVTSVFTGAALCIKRCGG